MRLMNKKSKVTLWIEPSSHQILKYTFDDLGWDFFPGHGWRGSPTSRPR